MDLPVRGAATDTQAERNLFDVKQPVPFLVVCAHAYPLYIYASDDTDGRDYSRGVCAGRIAGNGLLVIVTVPDATTQLGHMFIVIDPRILGLAPPRGRRPTPREMLQARTPYNAPLGPPPMREQVELDDDQLAESEAIRLARLEQQRRPPDLIQAYAA